MSLRRHHDRLNRVPGQATQQQNTHNKVINDPHCGRRPSSNRRVIDGSDAGFITFLVFVIKLLYFHYQRNFLKISVYQFYYNKRKTLFPLHLTRKLETGTDRQIDIFKD